MTGDVEPETYEGQIAVGELRTPDGPADLKLPTVKFVHYPGAQQLILWLPKPVHEGYDELSVTHDGRDVERGPVSGRISGSVQILFATLDWPPGDYLIAITHEGGWRHVVELKKYEAGVALPALPPEPVAEPTSREPIVYRDGFGNVIPDGDLEMRTQAKRDIARMFGRQLKYEGDFRSGTIIYVDGDKRIRFAPKAGDRDVKLSIELPSVDHWEGFTRTPLSKRDEIIAFVAERVRVEKANGWRYVIGAETINYYER